MTEWKPESHWDDHPDHPVEEWQYEVADGDTRQSYIQWVNSAIEIAEFETEQKKEHLEDGS
jgi:hypothetical protein